MSVVCKNPAATAARVGELLDHPEIGAEMVRRQHEQLDGAAAARICDFARELASGQAE